MTDLKQQIAMTSLNHMMASGHFNICTVDQVAKLLGVSGKCEAYDMLHPLHCMDWAKMPKDVREAVPMLIKECLGVEPVYQFSSLKQPVLDVETKPVKRGFLQILGGKE